MSTLGSRLLELRKQKGFTQEQLAEKLNVTNQSVSKWEKDINAPDITLLVELADLLETSVDYLLGRGGNKPVVTTTQKNIDQLVFMKSVYLNNRCPECGDFLVLRKGERGTFFGCHNFPRCKYTQQNI